MPVVSTYISFNCAKRLYEILGKNAPRAASNYRGLSYWWAKLGGGAPEIYVVQLEGETMYPAYQLHDILSPEFCQALAAKHPHRKVLKKYDRGEDLAWDIGSFLFEKNFTKGFVAMQKELLKMMEVI